MSKQLEVLIEVGETTEAHYYPLDTTWSTNGQFLRLIAANRVDDIAFYMTSRVICIRPTEVEDERSDS